MIMSSSTYNDPGFQPPPVLETTTTVVAGGSHIHRRISWAAIIGGVILVVTIQLLLSLLGAGIGLGTININSGTTPDASSLGIGAGAWWIITSIVALAFGGFAAAWMAGVELRWDGVLHGLITWGIATLLTLWLLSSAIGGIIGGGASALGGLASAAGSSAKAAAQPVEQASGVSPDMIQQQAQAYLKPANTDPATMSPQDAQKEVATNLATYANGGSGAADAKTRIIAVMAAQQHISVDQATQQFNNAQAKVQQQKAQAIQMAKDAADATAAAASKTAFAAFADLLIGLVAAAVGGSLAVQRRRQVARRIVA
jgi:hypothetical protein